MLYTCNVCANVYMCTWTILAIAAAQDQHVNGNNM